MMRYNKDNAVRFGQAAAHAGGEISKKAQDGTLSNQGSAALGTAFGKGLDLTFCPFISRLHIQEAYTSKIYQMVQVQWVA